MGTRSIVVLVVLLGAAFGGGQAWAQVPADESATPMGGQNRDERVRERDRMRREYEEMRETRAKALEEARVDASGSSGEQIPGWKGTGAAADFGKLAAEVPVEVVDDDDLSPVRPLEGTPKYLLYGAIALLGVVIVVRFRRGR